MGRGAVVDDKCLARTVKGFTRSCGVASTYNNGGCRGEACTIAATKARTQQRERAQQRKERDAGT